MKFLFIYRQQTEIKPIIKNYFIRSLQGTFIYINEIDYISIFFQDCITPNLSRVKFISTISYGNSHPKLLKLRIQNPL